MNEEVKLASNWCSRCKQNKSVSEFYKCSTNKNGFQDRCIPCCKAKSKEWYENNKDTFDKDARRERLYEWRKQNREQYLAYNRKWVKENPEKYKAASKRCYEKRKDSLREGNRNRNLKKKYGLSPEQYKAMFEAQSNTCAVCKSPEPFSKFGWHVDHCHTTGAVRGILCNRCNVSMGLARDSVERLQAMIDYLNKAIAQNDA